MKFDSRQILLGVVVLVFLGLAGYSVATTRRGSVSVRKKINLVCVTTGERVRMHRDEVRMLPAKNPKTGKRTLFPYETRDGQDFVIGRYRSALTDLKDDNKYVNEETLAITAEP
ncbi:MAG: hypothetical protein PVI86_03715 [Phycisphaerae bacterium]|jgi:hypothetical protein